MIFYLIVMSIRLHNIIRLFMMYSYMYTNLIIAHHATASRLTNNENSCYITIENELQKGGIIPELHIHVVWKKYNIDRVDRVEYELSQSILDRIVSVLFEDSSSVQLFHSKV